MQKDNKVQVEIMDYEHAQKNTCTLHFFLLYYHHEFPLPFQLLQAEVLALDEPIDNK